MALRKQSFAPGEYYHLYNRGTEKRIIFKDVKDYRHFLFLMYICNTTKSIELRKIGENFDRGETLVDIGAYCLMPNHFHILITPLSEDGMSRFMQKLSTAYVMYFNRKYKRTGSLFQGKFKAEHVDNDVYLKYIFSYIHLNPVKLIQKDWKQVGLKDKQKAFSYLTDYYYSSFKDYLDEIRVECVILSKGDFPDYFMSKKGFIKEISTWINYKPL